MAAPGSDFAAKAIASLLGITERRLQQLAQAGFIPKSERGMYPLIGSVQGYIRYLKQRGRESNKSSQHQHLARAQTVKVEMENRRRAGEYIVREQVHEVLSILMTTLTGALEGIPGRTANEYAAMDDAGAIRHRQQEELRQVRSVLADALDQFAESIEDFADHRDDDAPAAEADAEPVGEPVPGTAAD